MAICIGTSGWSYDHWEGVLYPEGAPASERLAYYTRRFRTVEVNATYYRWPADAAFASWRSRLPDGFLLSVKAPRGLTHYGQLFEPEEWIGRIVPALRKLEDRLGVFLVQLPPTLERDDARLDYFLAHFPSDIRTAVEFRNPSWHCDPVFDLLRRHNAAYCAMSGAHLPCLLVRTASFVYVRLHGPDPDALYGGSYPDEDLGWWAERVREWASGGADVFAYFNNDGGGAAVRNAEGLCRRVPGGE